MPRVIPTRSCWRPIIPPFSNLELEISAHPRPTCIDPEKYHFVPRHGRKKTKQKRETNVSFSFCPPSRYGNQCWESLLSCRSKCLLLLFGISMLSKQDNSGERMPLTTLHHHLSRSVKPIECQQYVALRTSTKVDVDTLALSGGARVAKRPGPSHRPRLYVGFLVCCPWQQWIGETWRESRGRSKLVVEPRWFNHTISSPESTTDCFGRGPSKKKNQNQKPLLRTYAHNDVETLSG